MRIFTQLSNKIKKSLLFRATLPRVGIPNAIKNLDVNFDGDNGGTPEKSVLPKDKSIQT